MRPIPTFCAAIRLYDFELSGNCYKVRLLLGMLGLEYERVPVDSSKGETQTPAFKTLSPRGQIPVLEGRLQDRDWLEGEVATIADIACYPYAALADEAGVALGPYPAVRAWLERFAALPAYHTMPGL